MKKLNLRLVLLFLQFIGIIFVSGKRLHMLSGTPDLAEITAKIMRSCYSERFKEIGLAGNFSDSFFASVASGDSPFSTISVNNDFNDDSVINGEAPLMLRYKLQIFAVAVKSHSELEKTLVRIKNSRWWNHLARFYIFDSENKIRCSDAFRFLWTAWTMDILKAKFICNHDNEGPLIYMFNPYTNNAGDHWKLEGIYNGVNNHPWSLFVRKYDENVMNCHNIDFDQTRNLDGHEVRISIRKHLILSNYATTGKYSRFKSTEYMLQSISRYLKAPLKFICHGKNQSLGFIDEDGKGHGLIKNLVDGQSDFVFQPIPMASISELPGSSYVIVHFFAVTQYTGYPSQWEKFISAIDFRSRIGLCIVILANLIFFKYAFRQSFSIAFLNTVRIICNSCLVKCPRNVSLRIYLACLFCFFIVIQALYQGELASRLTKHDRYPNINNKRDLLESSYTIGVYEDYYSLFGEMARNGRVVSIKDRSVSCIELVSNNSSLACLYLKEFLIDGAIKWKLHMSKNPVSELLLKFPFRKNWPLEEKFNRFLSCLVHSGLKAHDLQTIFSKEMHILDINENGIHDEGFKVIKLEDLDFAFFIIPFGLGCAAIVFFIELYVGRNHLSRKKKARVRSAWGRIRK